MTDQDQLDYYYTNKLSRIILISFEEIIGHDGLSAVLNHSDLNYLIATFPDNNEPGLPFDEFSRIHLSLEQLYGPRGGRGIALRSGRQCFINGLREFGEEYGITDTEFRVFPLDKKISTGIGILASVLNDNSSQLIKVREQSDRILWIVDHCPICWDRQTDTQVCYMTVGMLQEGLFWVSGGRLFNVEEMECIAKGDRNCTIEIDMIALN